MITFESSSSKLPQKLHLQDLSDAFLLLKSRKAQNNFLSSSNILKVLRVIFHFKISHNSRKVSMVSFWKVL